MEVKVTGSGSCPMGRCDGHSDFAITLLFRNILTNNINRTASNITSLCYHSQNYSVAGETNKRISTWLTGIRLSVIDFTRQINDVTALRSVISHMKISSSNVNYYPIHCVTCVTETHDDTALST